MKMKSKMILTSLILSASSWAATATIAKNAFIVFPDRAAEAFAGRLYAGMLTQQGLTIVSTLDGANWVQQTLPNSQGASVFALASSGSELAVIYLQGASQLSMVWCTAPQAGICTWNGPVQVGQGQNPSLAIVKGTVYAVWERAKSIEMSTFPLGTWNPPPPTVIAAAQPGVEHQQPAVVGWWNAAAGVPAVDVYWHHNWYSSSPAMSSWALRRYSLNPLGQWTHSIRKQQSIANKPHPVSVGEVSASVNSVTGDVTVAMTAETTAGKTEMMLFNDTSEAVIPGQGRATIQAFPGCGENRIRVAADAGYTRIYDRSTLAPVTPATAVNGLPVATVWSRSVWTPTGGYTDYIDSIQTVVKQPGYIIGIMDVEVTYRRVSGIPVPPFCAAPSPKPNPAIFQ